MLKLLFTQTSDPAAVFSVPALVNRPSRNRSQAELSASVPLFVLAPVALNESGAPRIVNVSVEATVKVAFALVSRLLIVAFATEIEVGDAGLTWQSLVELGVWCGLQLSLSKKFRLCPPIQLRIDIDACGFMTTDAFADLETTFREVA